MNERGVLYRFNVRRYSNGVDEFDASLPGYTLAVNCDEYPILKRTPKGAWIDDGGRKRFVRLSATKQYACPTVELAAESFRRRKTRQIAILMAQLDEVEAIEAECALRQLDAVGHTTETTND